MTRLGYRVTGTLRSLSAEARRALTERAVAPGSAVAEAVTSIVQAVRERGDDALHALARELDGVSLDALEVPRSAWKAALGRIPADVRLALERAARNIARAHAAWSPQGSETEIEPGVRIVRRPVPLARAGVYAPGGRAAYASSLLMGVVPARLAGVPDVMVCSPPGPNGVPADLILAAAEIAGATRLFSVGGAGAIAAMALGTQSIPVAACIVGPGNAYVTEAKQQLMRHVRVDLPAGPSEVLVIVDDSADIAAVAAELAAQAEHGPDSAAVAIVVGGDLAASLDATLGDHVASQSGASVIRAALASRGALLVADSLSEALAFADDYAPEHLLLATRDAAALAECPRIAGSVFVGCTSSVVLGDYVTGANHVLPTAGHARLYSGLSTDFFVRWTTVQTVSREGARALGPLAAALAAAEGLHAHAAAALRAAGDLR